VRTEFDTTITKFKWRYSFSDSGRLDAGLTAGLSTFLLKISLEGEATLHIDGEEQGELVEADEGEQFLAPIPLIGFYVHYAFTPRVIMRVGADALDLSIGEHTGRVLETELLAELYASDLAGTAWAWPPRTSSTAGKWTTNDWMSATASQVSWPTSLTFFEPADRAYDPLVVPLPNG